MVVSCAAVIGAVCGLVLLVWPGRDDDAVVGAGGGGAAVPAPPADAQAMRVRWVYDGDTAQLQAEGPGPHVTVTAPVDVRLIGVDTPELRPTPQCHAQEATDALRSLLPEDTRVLVAPDRESRDAYRRWLFYVWRADDALFVNHEIVAGGHGTAIRIWPNIAYLDQFRAAQADAEEAGLGLWAEC
ncbi:MAG TPA: thermonuclease family protein [Jiangellaceae bacterium]